MTDDQKLVSHIVSALTGEDDCFEMKRSIDERGVLLELMVDNDHMGRVIGKGGETANGIRGLLRALGLKNQARYNLVIRKRS